MSWLTVQVPSDSKIPLDPNCTPKPDMCCELPPGFQMVIWAR